MSKNKKSKKNDFFKISYVILIVLTLIFAYLYLSTNSKNNILKTENNLLKEKSDILNEIINYQENSSNHIARAEEITINLDDYATKWSNSEINSLSEQRNIERYKEELDKLKVVVEENNNLMRNNSDLLNNYLSINSEEIISSNNLLYTAYEDDYYYMINYVE